MSTDEAKLHSESARGTRAQEKLDELGLAFDLLAQNYFEAFRKSDPRDSDGRERLYLATGIISLVEAQLRQVADTGKVARSQIEDIRKYGKRSGIFSSVA